MPQDITIRLEQPKAFKELKLKPKFCPKSNPQLYKFNWIYTTNLSGDIKTVFTGEELGELVLLIPETSRRWLLLSRKCG